MNQKIKIIEILYTNNNLKCDRNYGNDDDDDNTDGWYVQWANSVTATTLNAYHEVFM